MLRKCNRTSVLLLVSLFSILDYFLHQEKHSYSLVQIIHAIDIMMIFHKFHYTILTVCKRKHFSQIERFPRLKFL